MTATALFTMYPLRLHKAIMRMYLKRKISLYTKSADVERAIGNQSFKNAAWFEKQAMVAASDLRSLK
jgi:hypothetical protein